MLFEGIELCCPRCRSGLDRVGGEATVLRCRECQSEYPVILGIPDLRVFPDPYISPEEDAAKGLLLAEKFVGMNFEELVDYYYSITPAVPPQHAHLYRIGIMSGRDRASAALRSWGEIDRVELEEPRGVFLDLGCGTGPLLEAAASKFDRLVGVDIAFRWLVVAKKRLLERGINATLICACAEALPFQDGVIDYLGAESVLEHVRDRAAALKETHRTLRSVGRLFLSSPNRYSLGPDPQTGIWGGGFLPDWIVARIVRLQGGIPPKRRLLNGTELRNLIRGAGFSRVKLGLPDLPQAQMDHFRGFLRLIADLYAKAKENPVGRQFLLRFGPILHAAARKPADT